MFLQIRGANPQTGEPVDLWDCVFTIMALLTIENSQQQRQTGAAIESFRNEMVRSNVVTQNLMLSKIETGDEN
jgi:hypothetical protein